jgi:hypothetical protein
MNFENEKKGLQNTADALNLAMTRGAFGFDDIDLLSNAKHGLRQQYTLLDGGLAAVLGQSPIEEPVINTPKLAIAQPVPDPDLEKEATSKKSTTKNN